MLIYTLQAPVTEFSVRSLVADVKFGVTLALSTILMTHLVYDVDAKKRTVFLPRLDESAKLKMMILET